MRNFLKFVIFVLVFLLLGCNRPVMVSIMNGFDQGKRTMKLEYHFFNDTLESGEKGFRMESMFHFAIGNKANLKKERTAFLDKNFAMVKSEAKSMDKSQLTQTSTWVDGAKIHIKTTDPKGKVEEKVLDYPGPVLVELHPLIYARDLKAPGMEKQYSVLYEEEARVVPITVRYVGPETIYEDNKAIPALHYQVQVITSPAEYDDIFVDPKTKNLVKIQFGLIKFLPAE